MDQPTRWSTQPAKSPSQPPHLHLCHSPHGRSQWFPVLLGSAPGASPPLGSPRWMLEHPPAPWWETKGDAGASGANWAATSCEKVLNSGSLKSVNGLMWWKIGKSFTGTRWSLRSSPKSRVFLCVSFEQSGSWGMAWHGECMVFLKVGWRILSDRNFGILGKLSQNPQNLGPVSGLLARLRRCFLIGATHAKIRSKKWSHPRQGESNSGCYCPYFFSRIVLWNQTRQSDFWIIVAFCSCDFECCHGQR